MDPAAANARDLLRVRDVTTAAPSGPVRFEAVKVVFTLSGWADVHAAGKKIALSPGTVLMIPAGMECEGIPHSVVRTVTLYLCERFVASQMRWLSPTQPVVHYLRQAFSGEAGMQSMQLPSDAVHDLSLHLGRLVRLAWRPSDELALLTLASEALHAVGTLAVRHVAGAGTIMPGARRPSPAVMAAIDLMRYDLARAWRMEDLASHVALSSSQLSRLFRSDLGTSPAAYLRGLRTERMAELLATTRISIGEAATASGWTDPSIASRAFKRRYGMSPRRYAALVHHRMRITTPSTRSGLV